MTARWTEPDDDQRDAWEEWKTDPSRPADMRAVAERFDPWSMYRLKTTGQRCGVVSFFESDGDQPVTLGIYAEHETLGPISAVKVIGVSPDDLEPWTGSERPEWEVEREGDAVSFRIAPEGGHGGHLGQPPKPGQPEILFWGPANEDKEQP